jgi:cytochrome c-type biogenesis protein CcsB
MRKIADFLFSPYLMGSLILLFAVSIATATFIENNAGSTAARVVVYNAKWFELLLLILVVNLMGRIIRFQLYVRKKRSIFLFHFSLLVILTGSALTRYFGFEGNMHIREGEQTNQILSQNVYFMVRLNPGTAEEVYRKDTRLSGYSGKKFSWLVKLNGNRYKIRLEETIPNAVETPTPDPAGKPVVSLIAFSPEYRQSVILYEGETKTAGETTISFNTGSGEGGISIRSRDSLLSIRFPQDALTHSMTGNQEEKLEKDRYHPFEKRKIYTVGEVQLVLQEMYDTAITQWTAAPDGSFSTSIDVFVFNITGKEDIKSAVVKGQINRPGESTSVNMNGDTLYLSYGRSIITLPFGIQLEDFQLERYPGSNSPSSYASEVTLIDPDNDREEPFRIYMNNVLKHQGYRFYQSSYDPDEKGTILSVNHDTSGTVVTYIGYFLLVLGILWSLLNRESRFRTLARTGSGSTTRQAVAVVGMLLGSLFIGSSTVAQSQGWIQPGKEVVPYKHSRKFGEVLVQDNNGRIKPLNTLASDVIRKVTRKEKFSRYHPTQLFLEMLSDPGYWQTVPLIKIGNTNLAKAMGVDGEYGSLMDFIDMTRRGEYKLNRYVEKAYSKTPAIRDKFDKEVIAVDERVNICYMIFTNTILDIFPSPGDPDNSWFSPDEAFLYVSPSDSLFIRHIVLMYFQSIPEAVKSDDWEQTDEYLDAIITYQYRNAGNVLPSGLRVKMEILYNNLNVFKKLFPLYSLLGLILLLLLISNIVVPKLNIRNVVIVIMVLLTLGFVTHTLALGIRWYISGHAPWSNGYESMIYVAWATMLAGFLFAKRSLIALSATAVLASLTLLVAHLSWMNPEITNLVPVLKSYWLTFHVSIITASYGFLGLGALLGLLNLILVWLKNEGNRKRIEKKVPELTRINEMALILGLYFLTIGTLLGAVWANESWGRYWGWDPKETWSLVTILVYTFILHMRHIPGLNNEYAFNLIALVGFGSVLMTYFGVNYYLTGLHSYAEGNPVPVPTFTYIILLTIFLLAVFAYANERKLKPQTTGDA